MSRSIAKRFDRAEKLDSLDRTDTKSPAEKMEPTPKTAIPKGLEKGRRGASEGVGTNCEQVDSPSVLSTGQPTSPPASSQVALRSDVTFPEPFEVTLDSREYSVHFWNGGKVEAPIFAMDTETELVDRTDIPHLALVSVSSAAETFLIHPNDIARFLRLHADAHLIFHNIAFDFWVLQKHLARTGDKDVAEILWNMAATNRLHDTMILDALVRLGKTGESPHPRALDVVAAEWAGIGDIDKSDKFRLRYGETIDKRWEQVEPGFFVYGAKDAIATTLSFGPLLAAARDLTRKHAASTWPDAPRRFGPLTEAIQVRGALALAASERWGMHVDQSALMDLGTRLNAEIDVLVAEIEELPEGAGLFKRDGDGGVGRTKTGAPRYHEKVLIAALETAEVALSDKGLPPIPRTKTGHIGRGVDDWTPYRPHSMFVELWFGLQEKVKLLGFTTIADGDRVHPRYSLLMRTGRTSCSNPNLQQIPRSGGFRECFTASPDHYLLAIDYAYVELCTLAATCLQRFGHSELAGVIKAGTDPHCHTAAMITGMSLNDFMALKEADPEKFKKLRQQAKALNFGIPGGLGPDRLREYARQTYGAELTEDEAAEFRRKLVEGVYPELSDYLADRTMEAIAANLGCAVQVLWRALEPSGEQPGWLPGAVKKILDGNPVRTNGMSYAASFVDRIWAALVQCCNNDQLRPLLQMRKLGPSLRRICEEAAVTVTGRLRASVTYTRGRNTPFQGLAADGAKIACFELVRAGYRLVAFVHDEFLIELPTDADHTAEAKRIESIVCGAMSEVMNDTVPVRAEYTLSTCWSKEAEAVWGGDRLLPWSPAPLD